MKRRKNYGRVLHNLAKSGAHFEHLNVSMNDSQLSQAVVEAIQSAKPNSLMTPVSDFRSPASAATFDILIHRDTIEIAEVLPVPIFGVLDQESDWIEIMNQFLTTGTTYVVQRGADRKSLDFIFTNGGNSDTINVSCNQVPYVNLLIAGLDSVFKLQQIKMQISDVAVQAQFSQSIGVFNRSFFGHHQDDSITPNQYKSDLQNQNDIRTINQILDIDKQRTILFKIVAAADFTVTLSSFIQKYDKGQSAAGF